MKPFKVVDYQAASDNLEQLKVRGKIKPAEFRRLSKGIANIQAGQEKGFAYDVDSKKGTFTAKNEKSDDARGKSGGVSGLNILEGRKTSKALGYLQKFSKVDMENDPVYKRNQSYTPTSNRQPNVAMAKEGLEKMIPALPAAGKSEYENTQAMIMKDLEGYQTEKPVFTVGSTETVQPPAAVTPAVTPQTQVAKTAVPKLSIKPMAYDRTAPAKAATEDRTYLKASEEIAKRNPEVVKSERDTYVSQKRQKERERWTERLNSAKTRGDFEKIKVYTKLLKDNPELMSGGKVPMGQNGFKVQPFQARKLTNSFLAPKPVQAGNFKVNQGITNRFLVDGVKPLPKGLTETPAMSYLRKPAVQSWQNFNPASNPVPTTDFGQGVQKYAAPKFGVATEASSGSQVVMPDGSMPEQERSPRKIDKFGAINTAIGAWGLANVAMAKEPPIKPTPRYQDKIRPFSGDREQLEGTLDAVSQGASTASNEVRNVTGSNTTAYLTGRSMIQKNTNDAKAAAYAADGQLRRSDRDRFDAQLSKENDINYNNQVADQKEGEARDMDRYGRILQTGQAAAQGSLAYSNAKEADRKNKEVELAQIEKRMASVKDAGKYQVLYGAIARGGLESLTPELRAVYNELMGVPAAPVGRNGMKISYFKAGGKVDHTPAKILADANGTLKKVMTTYASFVSRASRGQMQDFQRYVREINKVSRVNIKRS